MNEMGQRQKSGRRAVGSVVAACVLGMMLGGTALAVPPKIGYLDVGRAFDSYEKSKVEEKSLESSSNKKQAEREIIVDRVKQLREELELLSDKGRAEKQAQIDAELERLREFDTEARNELRRQRDAVAREILKEIDEAVQEYAKKEGFSMIVNDRVLLYGDEQYDLTNSIIDMLNTRYGKR